MRVAASTAAAPRPLIDRLLVVAGRALVLLAALLILALSPMLLFQAGYRYEAPGGSALVKFHPATFTLLLGLSALALAAGNPLRFMLMLAGRLPGAGLLLLLVPALMLHLQLALGLPITGVVETFAVPALFAWGFACLTERDHDRLAVALHGFMALNALIALGEFLGGQRLIPFVVGEEVITWDWRSTALLGHPLVNAAITGIYVTALVTAGGRGLGRALQLPAVALQLVALPAFGGRAATVAVLAIMLVVGTLGCAKLLRRGLPRRKLPLALLLLPALALAGGAALAFGLADRFLERFVRDDQSAEARILMFRLFEGLTLDQLLLGPPPALITARQYMEGIEFGIESTWVALPLIFGVLPSLAIVVALVVFWREQLQRVGWRRGLAPFLVFVVAISAAMGLAAKTTLMSQFVVMLLTVVGAAGRPPAGRS